MKRRRIVEVLVHFAIAIIVGLPLLVGPARGPLLRALAADEVHHCACGMEAGKCGCPECKLTTPPPAAEHERAEHPAFRSGCEDGSRPLMATAFACLAPAASALLEAPSEATLVDRSPPRRRSNPNDRPPVPPPRVG